MRRGELSLRMEITYLISCKVVTCEKGTTKKHLHVLFYG